MNNIAWIILTSSIVALIAVNWAYFKILKIAKDKKLVDNPDARKLQKEPIPVMGGIAVFFGLAVGVLTGAVMNHTLGMGNTIQLIPIMMSMVVMLYTGAIDDILGLTPRSRFVIEILTVLGLIFASGYCIDSLHGIWGIGNFSWYLAVPLTIVAGVGIINAINMIDGVNGLSSGLCIVCCCCFGIAFLKVGDIDNAMLAFTMIGALLPFLIHNVFGLRSRMFVGDAGTMVMGVLMAWFTICLLSSRNSPEYYALNPDINLIAFALATLSVPVFDTLRVMTVRILHKKSPFHPDKTHLHHAFVNVGVSHFITSVSELVIDLCVVAIWAIAVKLGASTDMQLYITIVAAVVLVCGTYFVLQWNTRHHTNFLHWLTHVSIRSHLGRTSWWKHITALLDAPEDRLKERIDSANRQKALSTANRFNHINPHDHKEMDRKAIYDFMKGRAEVYVEDIRLHSGADPMRVYPILYEEIQTGYIKVIRESYWGAFEIVALNEES